MRMLAESTWNWQLYEDGPDLFLSVLCGSIGLYERCIQLSETQKHTYHQEGEKVLNELAASLRHRKEPHPQDAAHFYQRPGLQEALEKWHQQRQREHS